MSEIVKEFRYGDDLYRISAITRRHTAEDSAEPVEATTYHVDAVGRGGLRRLGDFRLYPDAELFVRAKLGLAEREDWLDCLMPAPSDRA